MAADGDSFQWLERPLHRKLLSFLIEPTTVAYLRRYVLFAALGEDIAAAIRRFCDQGYAEECGIDIVAEHEASGADLRRLLKQFQLKSGPTKAEMVESLLEVPAAADALRQKYAGTAYIRATARGREAVTTWEKEHQVELSLLQGRCHKAFLRGDAGEVSRLVADFNRTITGPTDGKVRLDDFRREELEQILTTTPHILKDRSDADSRCLRSAAAMKLLWPLESASRWLPEGLARDISAVDRVANLIMKHGSIRARLSHVLAYTGKVGMFFPARDVASCDQCRALSGKAFTKHEFPELPLPTCTSMVGCSGNLHPMLADGISAVDKPGPVLSLSISTPDPEGDSGLDDPAAERLERLKELHIRGLITDTEYQAARQRIIDGI